MSSLSSRVRTLRYSRSPCIFLFPGGGFQLLMFRTLRHWIHCNDTLVFTHNSFFLHSINDFNFSHHLPVVPDRLQGGQGSVVTSRQDVVWGPVVNTGASV